MGTTSGQKVPTGTSGQRTVGDRSGRRGDAASRNRPSCPDETDLACRVLPPYSFRGDEGHFQPPLSV